MSDIGKKPQTEQKIPRMADIPSAEEVAAERERLQYQKRYRQTLKDRYIIVLIRTGDFETGDLVGFYY